MQTNTQNDMVYYLKKKGLILIPNKYLTPIQLMKTKNDLNEWENRYQIKKRHSQVGKLFTLADQQKIYYLGILYESGRIVTKQIKETKETEDYFYYVIGKKNRLKYKELYLEDLE